MAISKLLVEYYMKGVTQCFILGPLLFNIFMDDTFHFKNKVSVYNSADDNTVLCNDKSIDTTTEVSVNKSITCIDWFRNNKMQANPDKIQAIILGRLGFNNGKCLFLNGIEIKC